MDANITKNRLGNMLSYDWVKILITAVAAIVFWTLIFTMTATRITSAQQFVVFNYMGNLSFSATDFYDVYSKAFRDGDFSDEVLEIDEFDLPTMAEVASTQLEAQTSVGAGDLIFAADIPNLSSAAYKDPVTGEDAHYHYLEELLRVYRYKMFHLDPNNEESFFKLMEKYLNPYFGGNYATGTLDKGLAEKDFRARIARNKDKRYKKEEQIQVGLTSEYERLEKYRDALVEFYGYLDKGYISITPTTIRDTKNPAKIEGYGCYSINLCPETDNSGAENPMKKLSSTLAYQTTYVDEQGVEKPKKSAVDMHVCFFRLDGVEAGYEYEGLLFVNSLIRHTLSQAV